MMQPGGVYALFDDDAPMEFLRIYPGVIVATMLISRLFLLAGLWRESIGLNGQFSDVVVAMSGEFRDAIPLEGEADDRD